MSSGWNELGSVSAAKLSSAHQQPHLLSQWLARFGRAYLDPAPDDSHTNLEWRRDRSVMVTGDVKQAGKGVSFGVNPATLSLLVLVEGEITDEAEMHGRTDEEAGDWMRSQLKKLGLEPAGLDAPLPYALPSSPQQGGVAYDQKSNGEALAEIGRLYHNADVLLREVVKANSHIKPGPSPVRIWPHHFDMATLISLESGDFETARAVGIGLAIPDDNNKEFYFYNYPWPRDERENLPALAPDTPYVFDGKVGAVQALSKIVGAENQETAARQFMTETVDLFVGLLQADMEG